MRVIASGIIFSLLLLWQFASVAKAGVSSFTDLASFQAAASSELFLLDFNGDVGVTDGMGFHPIVDFDSPESTNPDQVENSGGILRDRGSTIAPNGVGPIGGSFLPVVGGIAFDLSQVEGTAQTVRLFDSGGSLIGEATTPIGDTFFGVTSTTPISSFVIQNGLFPSGIGNDRYFVDNFRATAVVPEPSTIVSLLMGVVTVFCLHRPKTITPRISFRTVVGPPSVRRS